MLGRRCSRDSGSRDEGLLQRADRYVVAVVDRADGYFAFVGSQLVSYRHGFDPGIA